MPLPVETFIVPADYCLAIIDTVAYPSFVAEEWTLDDIRHHFAEQMALGTMVAWGTGAPGNWRIEVGGARRISGGHREFVGRLRATNGVLHLTSYDELTAAAQSAEVRLPRSGTEEWAVRLAAGQYTCRVVQLYDPAEAESEAVFEQESPHFAVEIKAARGTSPATGGEVPWFG